MPDYHGKRPDTDMNMMSLCLVPAKVRVLPDWEGAKNGTADAGVGSS